MSTESLEQSNSPDAQVVSVRPLLRDPADWLLLAAAICLGPLMLIHCWDLWARTDLFFFPILPLVSLALAIRCGGIASSDFLARRIVAQVLFVAGALSAVFAGLAFSPWLAWLAFLLIASAWMLCRFGKQPWYVIGWYSVAAWWILVLPIGDANDLTRALEFRVASSSGVLLDMLGVPQLVINDVMTLRVGPVVSGSFCRGVGSPYLLATLVVLLSMLLRRTLVMAVVTLMTVPFWAWAASVVHMTAAVYLQAIYEKNVVLGIRGTVVGAAVLCCVLVGIWLMQLSIRNLLLPFAAVSSNTGGIHDFFNWLVLWPEKDPLRERRQDAAELGRRRVGPSAERVFQVVLLVSGVSVLAAGVVVAGPLLRSEAGRRMVPLAIDSSVFNAAFQPDALPQEFGGMRRVFSDAVSDSGTDFSRRHAAQWTYVRGLQRVEISIQFSHRGFFPLESGYLTPLSRLAGPRESLESEIEGLGKVMVDDVVILDDLYGRSFLSYATIAVGTPPTRTLGTGASLGGAAVLDSISLQPTVVNVAVYVEGTRRLGKEAKDEYRAILMEVCARLRPSIQKCSGSAEH